jgi:uncharacterized protein with PQ loop repeat
MFFLLVGWLSNILVIYCWLPQIYKCLKTKTTKGLSFNAILIRLIALILYCIYVINIRDFLLLIGTFAQLTLGFFQLYLFIYYKKHNKLKRLG